MDKNLKILLIIMAIVIVATGILAFSKSASQNKEANINTIINNQNQMKNETLADGLQIIDEVAGTGAEAAAGNIVSVNYVGTLTNGKKFDSSYDRNQPFSFVLGAGQVIKGWDEGVAGMRVGGKRKLVIPPDLAYGAQSIGNGLIPANSTLIFEVELLGIQAQ
ncbi:MAG: FKBP-type peptidyl-prolyl cis-trans isomerase [bacterium]|nr:FKBP-type peptidyl-prolyl cis-trans isomerase [bacterium]